MSWCVGGALSCLRLDGGRLREVLLLLIMLLIGFNMYISIYCSFGSTVAGIEVRTRAHTNTHIYILYINRERSRKFYASRGTITHGGG